MARETGAETWLQNGQAAVEAGRCAGVGEAGIVEARRPEPGATLAPPAGSSDGTRVPPRDLAAVDPRQPRPDRWPSTRPLDDRDLRAAEELGARRVRGSG